MKNFEITVYNRTTGKIDEIFFKKFSGIEAVRNYCAGRSTISFNFMCEEARRGYRGQEIKDIPA